MPDALDAIIGGVPTDKESQLALAQQLRKQMFLGQLGQLAPEAGLSDVGNSLTRGAYGQAQQLAQQRQEASQAEVAASNHADLLAHQGAQEKMSRDEHQDTLRWQQAELNQRQALAKQEFAQREADRAATLKLAQDKAAKTADGKPLPAAVTNKLNPLRDTLEDVTASMQAFKPEYAGAGQGYRNFAGNHDAVLPGFMVPNNAKPGADWWNAYGRNFTMEEMHRVFGARVSPAEMKIFEANHISTNMSGEQIQNNLRNISTELNKRFKNAVELQADGGANSGQIENYRQSYLENKGIDDGPKSKGQMFEEKYGSPPAPAAAPPPAQVAAPPPTAAQPPPTAFPNAMAMQQPRLAPQPGQVFPNAMAMAGIQG